MSPIHCRGCGAPTGAIWPETPIPDHCEKCPPWTCDGCGQPCSMSRPCACVIPVSEMSHADLKAVFAASDMGLSPPRTSSPPSYQDAISEAHRPGHEPIWEMCSDGIRHACKLCGFIEHAGEKCGYWVGPVWKTGGETCVCNLPKGHDKGHMCSCGAWFDESCGHPPEGRNNAG